MSNTAKGGAVAASLADQARAALNAVPTPQLVIVQTIDNDVRCDGTDATHVAEFGTSVAEALDVITSASPHSRILMVAALGRPSPTFVLQLIAADPAVKATMTGTGTCDFFDPSGALNEEHFQNLTNIGITYETEEARACAAFPQCSTDGGVRASWIDQLDYFTDDENHLNVSGLAAEAEQIWPTIEAVLKLTPADSTDASTTSTARG